MPIDRISPSRGIYGLSWRWCGTAGLLATLLGAPADAAMFDVVLTPSNTTVGLTVFALGLFPQSGRFTQFAGKLAMDPSEPMGCHVDLTVQVPSIDMTHLATERLALGPSMLDATHFPTMTYHGICMLNRAVGRLTMHGVTRDIVLDKVRSGDAMSASGSLHRQDYGVSGLPGVIGGTVLIHFSVRLPAELSASLPTQAR